MAIHHLRMNRIARSKGRSATAAAAYRSGSIVHDERTDLEFNYTRKDDVYGAEIFAPLNAPTWVYDRNKLWNSVEHSEKRKDALVALEHEVALPIELTHEQKQDLVRQYVLEQHASEGKIVDIAYHNFDGNNPHAHILFTVRPIDENGFGKKVKAWDQKQTLKLHHKAWADYVNDALERAGHDVRVDHRSYAERNIFRIPQIHLGAKIIELENRGIRTDRGDIYRLIELANQRLEEMERSGLYDREEMGLAVGLERELIEQIKADIAASQSDVFARLASDSAILAFPPKHLSKTDRGDRQSNLGQGRIPTFSEDQRQLIDLYSRARFDRERSKLRAEPTKSESQASPENAASSSSPAASKRTLPKIARLRDQHQDRHDNYRRFVRQRCTFRHSLRVLGKKVRQRVSNVYGRADRYMAERLAKRGLSREAIRRIVANAYPELMRERSADRYAYVRRIVDPIYQRVKSEQAKAKPQAQASKAKNSSASPKEPKSRSIYQFFSVHDVKQLPAPPKLPPLTGKEIKKAQNKCVYASLKALEQPDWQGYNGHATREFRKELARKAMAQNMDVMGVTEEGINADRDIAIKLFAARYSPSQIRTAIMKASPRCTGIDEQQKLDYVRKFIINREVMYHPQVIERVKDAHRELHDQGYGRERRLEQLNLHTIISPKRRDDRSKNNDQDLRR
ncbi:MobA/MobL protein (plasmid) [Thalassoporum mexicanum PCC 7367]|uniref:MobQ family relaxase n=1 Tax=Thalassoporum mexicanum TaxID=3457544 RepID=UPI00029FEBA8|nr:MobA/MobL protein [Pseudanabaena sp. PCC 7367]